MRRVVIATSDSTRALAERLGALYTDRAVGVRVQLRPGNAESALAALQRGDADLAIVDRQIPESARLRSIELAREPVAIIANPANPIANASTELLSQLYSGRLRDWSEVGGPPGAILLLTREEGDGSRATLERAVLGGRAVTATALLAPSEAVMIDRVATHPTAIGYVGLGAVTGAVKVVPVNNVPPSIQGGYTLVRPILLVTRFDGGSDATAIADLATSAEGRAAVAGLGR
ncbi:MAG: phosphate ABC transporter substrate-binding protein [Dehalococcoidia bacterium]|nr:MAG: phosphate ABC transporter substrate-binding protein [Dehalococcoidia bacterium]